MSDPRPASLVAREEDIAKLTEQWAGVVTKRSRHLVFVSGEAGIGKSRLLQAFKQSTAQEGEVLEGYGSPFQQNTALGPVAQALEAHSGAALTADPLEKFAALQTYLDSLGIGESAALLAQVIDVSPPSGSAAVELSAQGRRPHHASAGGWIRALARRRPVLFALEDLQWADPSTLELFETALSELGHEAVMFLATHRLEFVSPWTAVPDAHVVLQRLAPAAAEDVIALVTRGKALPRAVIARITELADGVPLYLEEVTKSVLESGALRLKGDQYQLQGPLPDNVLPATVRDSLAARLDRLGPEQVDSAAGIDTGSRVPLRATAHRCLGQRARTRERHRSTYRIGPHSLGSAQRSARLPLQTCAHSRGSVPIALEA